MANALTWFEIPTQDLDRAVRFYETVLGVRLRREVFGGVPHALFPVGETDIGGALIHDDHRKPSLGGTLVYLDAAGKLDACVEPVRGAGGRARGGRAGHPAAAGPLDACGERVRGAGGTLLMPKTAIGEYGFIAVLGDTEGNSVAPHSPRAGCARASRPTC